MNKPTFETNGFYEKLLKLRRSNPKAFKSISPASKLALAHYEVARREYKALSEVAADSLRDAICQMQKQIS